MISETKIIVRYVETDQMGIVHHSNYFSWFEVGRTELFKEMGLSYKEVEKMGIFLPLVESSCSYKIGAQYEDELVIQTTIEAIKGARVYLTYKVIREDDNKVLAEGKTIHAFTDSSFKPINIKKVNPEFYNKLLSYL